MNVTTYHADGSVTHSTMPDGPPTVVTATPAKCEHSHDFYDECVVDRDGRTSCCDALYTFSGDGEPYCKCCQASVVDADPYYELSIGGTT